MENENIKNQPVLELGIDICEYESLSNLIDNLNNCVHNLGHNFISIGFYLSKIKEHKKFIELGYESIYEYTEENFNFSKTTTKNFISVFEKFGNKKSAYPSIEDKYSKYNFSQLVELVGEKDNIDNYSPLQTIKEIRVTKFKKKLSSDNDKLNEWFKEDLFNFLKSNYPKCKLKFLNNCYLNLIYKDKTITFYINSDKLLAYNYSLKKFKSSQTIFSCKLVKHIVDGFIDQVDKYLLEVEAVNNGPTSDQVSERVMNNNVDTDGYYENGIVLDEDLEKEVEIEVLDIPEHKQFLKNNDQRWDYLRDKSNYELLEKMSNEYVKFYKLKHTPFVEVVVLVNQYNYSHDKTLLPEYRSINVFKLADNQFLESIYNYQAREIVDYLREKKI